MSEREYIVLRGSRGRYDYYHLDHSSSDPYDHAHVRSIDRVLHRTLRKIFQERRLTSGQIRQLIRAPKKRNDRNSIFKLILQRKPALGKMLLKRNKLSLLWIAVLCCYQNSAELLVRYGADVNERYELDELTKKSTILHALLQMYPSAWNERFIDLVIEHVADIDARDSDRSTHLHLAVEYDRVMVAETLLDKCAEVDAVDGSGSTPLLNTLSSSKLDELVPLLVEYGANVEVRDAKGRNALHRLASAPVERADLARVLIKRGVSLDERTRTGQFQPIHLAVYSGYNELVKLFLDHGADVNARMLENGILLELAYTLCDNTATLLTLLKRGANIDLKTIHGRTVLHSSCETPNAEKIKILLSVGADMFAQDLDGDTPFEVICRDNLENPSIRLMLKALALRKAYLQPSTEFKGEMIVKKYPVLWNCYQACVEEINRIKATKLVKSGAFFELLTKCQCQVVPLMRNRKFESEFRLYDLEVFPMYVEDILEAFERAEKYYQSILKQIDVIKEAVYNVLPYIVARKVAGYTMNCEICELKEIVHASRGTPAAAVI